MKDLNDPQHLTKRMHEIMEREGCSITQAADRVYATLGAARTYLPPLEDPPNFQGLSASPGQIPPDPAPLSPRPDAAQNGPPTPPPSDYESDSFR
jgi:hypothetical protein